MVNTFDLFSVFAHSPADCEASPQNLKKVNFLSLIADRQKSQSIIQ